MLASEWRQMSDGDQRAMIGVGITDVEDLPEDFRREVEEMLRSWPCRVHQRSMSPRT